MYVCVYVCTAPSLGTFASSPRAAVLACRGAGFELTGSAGEEGIRCFEFKSWRKTFLECVCVVCVCEREGE